MRKPPPRWIWPAVIAAMALCGALFVLTGETQTETHSWQERLILTSGLVVGAILVTIYWSRKWLRLRNSVKPGEPLFAGVSRRASRYILLLPIIALMVALGLWAITSMPSYKISKEFVRTSAALAAVFGKVDYVRTTGGFEVMGGNTPSGSYDFYVEGDQKSGVVRVKWKEKDGKFDPFEIDSVSSDDAATKIWSNEP